MSGRSRKRFLPTVLFSILAWIVVLFFVFFVDPEIIANFPIRGSYFLFFLFLFVALFLSSSLLFYHVRRGFFLAAGVVLFLYLRLYGLGHFLNFLLLFSFLLILDFAASSRSSS